ncbi:ornithine cyclodeaminase family protein [Phenylobacterium montanum]|uniref:Ornithine cyclodeaminase family protein n=1 Tax=Phenylobacterium montanum TaxID=2823693 RepID=A0A975FYS3_9CAUL|nr:ornithine cyclodeaminase family protein [Caulobacter sp. S6]QUD87760.1 ornithine cyclodeaminase family protein [Caulobacter sp. S6]
MSHRTVQIRVLNGSDIRALLPMAECIDLMGTTMAAVSQGRAVIPLRSVIRLPGGKGMFGVMPGALAEPDGFGVKLLSLFPGNVADGYSSHLGLVMLFEPEHGLPVAMMDAAAITAIRTAAASGLATGLLARPDAGDLAILGAGEQAHTHLEAMSLVRPLRRVRVWARRPEQATAFAEAEGRRLGLAIETAARVAEAARGADLICTLTGAKDPILTGEMIAPGAHLNVVGSSVPSAAEIDTNALLRARLFVDRRESTLNEGGEFRRAVQAGALDESHILGEIGEVATGAVQGRLSETDITLYKSLGIAAQDLASAHLVLERAREQGLGQVIEI